jgi:hypothetical protein
MENGGDFDLAKEKTLSRISESADVRDCDDGVLEW